MSIRAVLYDMKFKWHLIYSSLLLNILILFSPCVSFLSLLVFVLRIEGKGPRCSDSEFDSCAIHAHVTLRREGACTSSISVASWITAADYCEITLPKGYTGIQEKDYACHVRDNRISGTEKGEITGN
jgi:hypothetical protein